MAEYKLLDPNRKAILQLPSGAVHLWLTYKMFESDNEEAYPSNSMLEKATGMVKKTIIKWREYLLETRWLLKLEGSAAERYSRPTRGANNVGVYRTNDPTTEAGNSGTSESVPLGEVPSGIVLLEKLPPKVYGSTYRYDSRYELTLDINGSPASPGVNESLKNQKPENQEPNQNQKQRPSRSGNKLKHHPNYDAPFPSEFDEWSPDERAQWAYDHQVKESVKNVIKLVDKPQGITRSEQDEFEQACDEFDRNTRGRRW
jgi:hypothetical protein